MKPRIIRTVHEETRRMWAEDAVRERGTVIQQTSPSLYMFCSVAQ